MMELTQPGMHSCANNGTPDSPLSHPPVLHPSHMLRRAVSFGIVVSAIAILCLAPVTSLAAEPPEVRRVSFEQDHQLKTVTGEVVAENPEFGQLLLDADGALTAVSPSELKRVEVLDQPLKGTSPKELGVKTLALMPAGSKYIVTDHFVICYNTSDAYARWNANLYDRLYKGFHRYWKERGVELKPPRFPMVALVFATQADYLQFANKEFPGAESTLGYYHQSTNRLASFDLTGVAAQGVQLQHEDMINQVLSRPEAERNVATIVHEACHQIAYNCGLQVRLGDNPLWLSEGVATFFESPDFSSTSGWGGTGKINYYNFNNLRQYLPRRPPDSLEQLLVNDDRMRQAASLTDAYAESWGLTFFLIKKKPKQMAKYLQMLRERSPGNPSDPKERLEDFRSCFGAIDKLDKEFLLFLKQLR